MRYLRKVLAEDEYVLRYNVHLRHLGKLQKIWEKLGITWEKGDALDQEDEYEYLLEGSKKALTDFYRSAFGEEPGPGELKKA